MKFQDLKSLYELPFFELISESRKVHELNWPKMKFSFARFYQSRQGGVVKTVHIALKARDIKAE